MAGNSGAASSQPIEPDKAAIQRHLELLVAPAVGGSLSDGLIELGYGPGKAKDAHLFPLTDLHQMVEFAVRVNQAGHQVWVGGALRKPGTPISKRTRKSAFYGSFYAWMDDAADWQVARAAWSACPPDLITCTGTVPAWRAQALWRFLTPITEPERLEEINRGIAHRLGGEDVFNADRLIRLAGSVNWPFKGNGRIAELVTLSWTNGSGSTTDPEAAHRVYGASAPATPSTAPAASSTAGPRNVFGQVELDRAIAAAAKPGRWHTVVRDAIAHLVGRKAPDDMIHLICRHFTQPGYTHEQTRADVEKLLAGARAKYGEETFDKVDQPTKAEPPLPLVRAPSPAAAYPVDALGTLLGNAARGIADIVQAPIAMCGQSVLAAAALAAQAHADVVLPTQQTRPTSLYFLSVAATGDRKSSCDREALRPVRIHAENLRTMFEKQLPVWQNANDLWKAERERILRSTKLTEPQKAAALAAMDAQPVRPLDPVLTSADPTIEGLVRFFARGQPAIGLFTDEGGQFIGSHAMNSENRLRTATAYSEFWDGGVFTRIRASEDTLILCGRRVSAHLMAQPDVAAMMLADPLLANQGLLSRILLSAPDSIVGTRLWHESAPESDKDISTYTSHLLTLLEDPPTMRPGKVNELFPRELHLSAPARVQWIRFADEVERQMVAGGGYESVRGLANKLGEHATRIAGVLALVEQPKTTEITAGHLEAGIELARYHAFEALRLHGVVADDVELQLAGRVLEWLRGWQQGLVSLADVYQRGPRPIRSAKRARQMMELLEQHGHIKRVPDGREAWEIPA